MGTEGTSKIVLRRKSLSPLFFINGEIDTDVIESLDEALSYFIENYERTDKFQSGQWDGKEHLMRRAKNGTYYFPFGLLDRVTKILSIYGLDYEVADDNYSKTDPMEKEIGKIKLRDYQLEAIEALRLCHNSSGVLALPTASGKTVIALAWLMHLKTQAIILVHRKELLNQWFDEILRLTDITKDEIGIVNDAFCDIGGKKQKRVYICMVQTLNSRMEKKDIQNVNTGLLIMDECHTIPARTGYKACSQINAEYRLGLSATPKRSDGAEMKIWAACGIVAKSITPEMLVEQGYITKPEFHLIVSRANVRHWAKWPEVYRDGIVNNTGRNAAIIEIASEHRDLGRQVYIHVAQVAHGKALKSRIDGAEYVDGSTPKKEREEIIRRYKAGEIRVLVSTLLKEGVSIDGISCLIYASGMKSEIATIQTIGRALRLDPNFDNALIYDFNDSGHKHLVEHTEQRIATYREVYGKLFNY